MSRAIISKQAPFSPTQISGCVLWLDGADKTTLFQDTGATVPCTTVNQVVGCWKDKSTTANNALSEDAVYYSGSGIYFPALAGIYPNPGLLPNGTSDSTWFFVINTLMSSGTGMLLASGDSGSSLRQFYISNGYLAADESGNPGIVGTTPVGTGSNVIFSCVESQTLGVLTGWQNGTQFGLNDEFSFNIGTSYAAIGTVYGAYPYVGYINEIVVFNTALSDGDRQQIEAYLAQKWGVKNQLPEGHPGMRGVLYPSIPQLLHVPYPSTFSPIQVDSLQLWLDAADTGTISLSGPSVTQWADKSRSGLVAGVNNSLPYPTYTSGATPYVEFGQYQALRIPVWNYSSSWTVIVAMNSVSLGARWFISVYDNLPLVYMGMAQPGNKIFSGLLPSAPIDITGNHIECTMAQNTNSTGDYNWYRDAQLQYTNTVGYNVPSTGGVGLGIGANQSGDYDIEGTYQIYELLIFNEYLSTPVRNQVEGYLAWKWGLQTNLPSEHPYYNNSPIVMNSFGIYRPQNLPIPPIAIYPTLRPSGPIVLTNLEFYLDAGNIASYPGSGSTWTDLAGSGLVTTLYGSPTYNSANGGYLEFVPSSTQYAATNASLAVLTNFTIEVWHYYNNTHSGNAPCILSEIWAGTPINYTLGCATNSYATLQAAYYGTGGWHATNNSYSLPSTGWYHIVGTYDGTNLKLYINNVLTQTEASSATPESSSLGIHIMRRWDQSGEVDLWGGYLAVLRIYSGALTAEQVTTNYNASKARFGLS